jgi:putative FmdB family regulatory protein
VPLYDYDCAACGRRFEVIHGVHGDPPAKCPLCGGGPVKKAITAASVHYRGTGWAKKERRAAIKSSSSSRGDDSGSESGSSESDKGSSASEGESSPAVPAAAGSGESSTETPTASKSGSQSKPPARTSD